MPPYLFNPFLIAIQLAAVHSLTSCEFNVLSIHIFIYLSRPPHHPVAHPTHRQLLIRPAAGNPSCRCRQAMQYFLDRLLDGALIVIVVLAHHWHRPSPAHPASTFRSAAKLPITPDIVIVRQPLSSSHQSPLLTYHHNAAVCIFAITLSSSLPAFSIVPRARALPPPIGNFTPFILHPIKPQQHSPRQRPRIIPCSPITRAILYRHCSIDKYPINPDPNLLNRRRRNLSPPP